MNQILRIPLKTGSAAVTRIGQGEPLVLLHGFGEDSRIFERITPVLSQENEVLTIDLPGFGSSDLLPGGFSIADVAQWLNETLEALDLDPVVIAGHSLGGYVALAFADRFPQKVKGLGLLHSKLAGDSTETIDHRNKTLEFLKKHSAKPWLWQFAPNLFKDDHHPDIPRMREIMYHQSDAAVSGFTRAMRDRPDMREIARSFRFPVLFVIGSNDRIIPFDQAMKETEIPPQPITWVLQEIGHASMYEAPERLIEALNELVQQTKGN